jgi:hypothetical protein
MSPLLGGFAHATHHNKPDTFLSSAATREKDDKGWF